jgi:hypothetical protein
MLRQNVVHVVLFVFVDRLCTEAGPESFIEESSKYHSTSSAL